MDYLYFDVEHAVFVQNYIIENSGGLKGFKDKGQLDAILDFVRNDDYYSTIEEKATYLFYSLNKSHAFNDGNKRSSIILTAYFFQINGLGFIVGKFIREIENISVDVADSIIDKELLFEIISSFINEDVFSDELKLKIINAKYKNRTND